MLVWLIVIVWLVDALKWQRWFFHILNWKSSYYLFRLPVNFFQVLQFAPLLVHLPRLQLWNLLWLGLSSMRLPFSNLKFLSSQGWHRRAVLDLANKDCRALIYFNHPIASAIRRLFGCLRPIVFAFQFDCQFFKNFWICSFRLIFQKARLTTLACYHRGVLPNLDWSF